MTKSPLRLALPDLSPDEAAVWLIHIPDFLTHQASLYQLLSETEKIKATSLLIKAAQTRFILARGLLRTLLSQHLNCHPQSLNFQYTPQGKPYLMEGPYFNLSHSQAYILIGIHKHPIGVDLEHLRPSKNVANIAKRFFSTSEYQALQSIVPEIQLSHFFALWTAKEAVIKALGLGIANHLNQIKIIRSKDAYKIHSFGCLEENPEAWQLHHRHVAPDYAACVAIKDIKTQFEIRNLIDFCVS